MAYKRKLVEGAGLLALCLVAAAGACGQGAPADGHTPPPASVDYKMAAECASQALGLASMLGSAPDAARYQGFGDTYTSWAKVRAKEKKLPAAKADLDIKAMQDEAVAMYVDAQSRGRAADALKHAKAAFELCEAMGRRH